MALSDFTLLAKLEDFDAYSHQICQKFQKSERHVLSASIRGNIEAIIFLALDAAKTQMEERRKKRPPQNTLELLKKADIRLEYLKMQIRKAHRLKQIDVKVYENWSGMARELGSILGGWIKSVDNAVSGQPKKPEQSKLF